MRHVYTVQEVADLLRVSTKTVYAIVRDRELSSIRVRGQIRITSAALQCYLEGKCDERKESEG